jgi:phospholipase/carboxylesterase
MKRSSIAGFDVVLAGGDDRPRRECDGDGGGSGPLVVMLHGFGAPGDDLVPFQRILDVPRAVRFAFPAAPLDLGQMAPGARAWWWIDMEERMRRMERGEARDENEVPEGFVAVAEKVAELVAALNAAEGPLVLAGFSQGAMLALEVALRMKKAPDALALLSSTLLAAASQQPRLARLAETPILQTHGRADPLLPFSAAERLREHLTGAGLSVTWVPFRGGHEIPEPATDALAALVRRVASQ